METTPRFVELEVLHQAEDGCYEWKEKSRWIKLEEDIEDGSERWSRPFVPILSFKALNELKFLINQGDVLLDVDCHSLHDIATKLCDSLHDDNIFSDDFVQVFLETLLARHRHQHQKDAVPNNTKGKLFVNTIDHHSSSNIDNSIDTLQNISSIEIAQHQKSSPLYKYMNEQSVATTILVATIEYVRKPVVVFVRLKHPVHIGNLNEIEVPLQFLVLVVGSTKCHINYIDVGKAIGTLMSDEGFGKLASTCQTKNDIISGVEEFLIKSTVLPHGQWDQNMLVQSITQWRNHNDDTTHECATARRQTQAIPKETFEKFRELSNFEDKDDPLYRSGKLFGGLIQDVKRKLPYYTSDFKDALNVRCVIAVIFVYFSFLAPAITFSALLSSQTKGLLGVTEMILSTSICGVVFGFFSGQPLIILGATGPLLIMETSIYKLAVALEIEFLPWRAWIGFWITIFCTSIVAFDLSFLVRYFTLFTEEIVAALISTVFIYESFRHMHLMLDHHYFPSIDNKDFHSLNHTADDVEFYPDLKEHDGLAFLTIILLCGTFMLCHYLRKIRHSQFFPMRWRRLLSDFGILMAVMILTTFDLIMMDDFTPKLDIPEGFTPTSPSKRGWVVNLLGDEKQLSVGQILFAIVPAFLVTIILFMETQITGTIVDRKEHKLVKGSGYSLDILIVGILITICSVFGLPWMCACPVHSISHLNSLSILSTNHAPGTRAQVTKVIEQRLTNIVMHLLIGLSIFLAPVLRHIPIAVLLGVFLYLGVVSLSHLQLINRVQLFFIPTKLHPDLNYIRKVKTNKIHLFTGIQLLGFLVVLVIENSPFAPFFPFVILLMIPLRRSILGRIFTDEELEILDNESDEPLNDDYEEYNLM